MGAEAVERPLIGVSTSEVRVAERIQHTPEGEPPIDREMALGMKYLRAIEAAGGLPLVIPPLSLEAVSPLLDRLSGVCLSGGPDLDPGAYTTRRHPRLGPTEPDLDRFELALAGEADARGLPILAICRGMQAINVARGGSLFQHLPDRPSDVEVVHRQSEPGERPTHPVEVAGATKLSRVLGRRRLRVNSFHHQAVRRLGRGLRAVAWSPDGVIEAIEAPGRSLLLGVQWHAECLAARAPERALFDSFVAAARAHPAGVEERRAA